jgi:hypothetical protein
MESPVIQKRKYNGPVKGSEEAKERMQRVRSSAQRNQPQPQQQQQQQQPQQQPQRRMNENTTSRMSSLNNALQSSQMPSVYQNPSWFQNS